MTNVTLNDASDSTALAQRYFDEATTDIKKLARKYFLEAAWRRALAYVLKAISIFGAIIVAAKIQWIPQTALGLTIAAAVGIDQVSSNHMRLISVVATQHAFERLYGKMVAKHTAQLPGILRLRDGGGGVEPKPGEAKVKLELLLAELTAEVHAGKETVLDSLREGDLKALNTLYVDQKR